MPCFKLNNKKKAGAGIPCAGFCISHPCATMCTCENVASGGSFLRIYRIMTPDFSQAVKVPSSHRLACTSPMWQVPIISIHRRL